MSFLSPQLIILLAKLLFGYLMMLTIVRFMLRVIRSIQSPATCFEDDEERPLIRKFSDLENAFYEMKQESEYRIDTLTERITKILPALPDTLTDAQEREMEMYRKKRARKGEEQN